MITDTYLTAVSPSENGETVICRIKYNEDGNVKMIKIPIAYSFYSDAGYPLNLDGPFPLDEVRFEELINLSKVTSAINKGLDLLNFSICSRKGIKDKLVMKGFDKQTAEKASEYLDEYGFIDEKSQAENYVMDMAENRLFGKIRIRNELFKKGYRQDVIDEVLENAEVDFEEICRTRIEKTMKKEDFADKKTASKNVNALMRYGFTFSEIKTAVKELK